MRISECGMRNADQSYSPFTPNSELPRPADYDCRGGRTPNDGVPWPIALLTLFYGVIATSSGVTLWRIATGTAHQALIWPTAWLAVSAGAMCGLPLLKPWGRVLAMCTSVFLLATTLAIAGVLVMAGRPWGGLFATLLAGCHAVVIRYLQRPLVKAYFGEGTTVSTQQTAHSRKGHGAHLLR